ncbi:MAG TPA: hypothetical protein DCK87_01005 [Desulfotomaculum sp.]|nr:hypothetical protein [Desulfotomaculum sp.]
MKVNRSKQNNIITLNKIKKTINLKKGDTEEEALENIKEAIIGCLEALNQRVQKHEESEKILEVALN